MGANEGEAILSGVQALEDSWAASRKKIRLRSGLTLGCPWQLERLLSKVFVGLSYLCLETSLLLHCCSFGCQPLQLKETHCYIKTLHGGIKAVLATTFIRIVRLTTINQLIINHTTINAPCNNYTHQWTWTSPPAAPYAGRRRWFPCAPVWAPQSDLKIMSHKVKGYMVIVVQSKMVTMAGIMRAHLQSTIRQRDASHVQ